MAKTNIYVLLLKDERYYIGKSNNVKNRFQQHLNGYGSAWTKKYKPIKLIKTIENISPFEEDKITKEYMSKYGIDKVRGGSYVEVELSEFHIAALNMEIWAAKDLCTQCGRKGHFVKNCYAKTDTLGNKIVFENTKTNTTTNSKKEDKKEKVKEKEYETDEWETVESDNEGSEDEWECEYCDRTFTTSFGCGVHEKSCKTQTTNTNYIKSNRNSKETICHRCGHSGHYSTNCYASKHIKGYYLD